MFDIEKARKNGASEISIGIMQRINENNAKREGCTGHVFDTSPLPDRPLTFACSKCGYEADVSYVRGYHDAGRHNECIDVMRKQYEETGILDKHGNMIFVGNFTRLVVDGDERIFKVEKKTVIRQVKNHPSFVKGMSKVAITGYVFSWNGYDLFPCVDENGIPDNEQMEIVQVVRRCPTCGLAEFRACPSGDFRVEEILCSACSKKEKI
jgi:ferredoxin